MVRQTRVHCPLDDWMMVLILLLGIRIVIVSIFTIGWMTIPHLYVIYVIYVYHIWFIYPVMYSHCCWINSPFSSHRTWSWPPFFKVRKTVAPWSFTSSKKMRRKPRRTGTPLSTWLLVRADSFAYIDHFLSGFPNFFPGLLQKITKHVTMLYAVFLFQSELNLQSSFKFFGVCLRCYQIRSSQFSGDPKNIFFHHLPWGFYIQPDMCKTCLVSLGKWSHFWVKLRTMVDGHIVLWRSPAYPLVI